MNPVKVFLKTGASFETTEEALERIKRLQGDNFDHAEVIGTPPTPPAGQPAAPQTEQAPTAPPATVPLADAPPTTLPPATSTDPKDNPKKLFGKKIKGAGAATISDILAIYPTEPELREALSNGEKIPVRDDVAKNLAKAFK